MGRVDHKFLKDLSDILEAEVFINPNYDEGGGYRIESDDIVKAAERAMLGDDSAHVITKDGDIIVVVQGSYAKAAIEMSKRRKDDNERGWDIKTVEKV